MRRAGWIAAAVAVVAVGCGPGDDTFRVQISWRDGPDQGCPARAVDAERRCESIPMTCASRARIRVVDAADPNRSYYTQCFELGAGGDACKLGELAIPRSQIPNTMVKVQVAVWSVDELGPDVTTEQGCPPTAEFVNGVPKLQNPLPAIGGEAYFDVGNDRTAEVELGCPAAGALDCPDTSVMLIATLYDLAVTRQTPADVPWLTVKHGVPVDPGDGSRTISNEQLTEMKPSGGPEPTWQLRLDQPPDGVQCLWVLFQAAQSTPALTCFEPAVDENRVIHARGFVVRPRDVNNVLKSMSIKDFPHPGLVVGLALTDDNARVPGTVVMPTPPSPISYPDSEFSQLEHQSTSELGMFVSIDAPFGAAWRAAELATGKAGTAVGGLVAEHVTVVPIRMAPATDAGVPGPLDASVDAP